MKLKICDMEAETDKVAENNFLDLLEISGEFGEEEENQLFQWIRPLHLDDEDGNPNPRIAAHVREAGVNVERVLSEEVHSESFSQDTRDSFQPAVTSRPSFDLSVEHSSRPSFAGTSTTGYDGSRGEGTNDGSDNGNDGSDNGNDVREAGVNVERVLSEEVHSESFSQDTRDSFQPAVTSRPSFDLSVEHSSRPSFAGTSTTGYDGSRGEGTNDGSDNGNDGGDIADPQKSQYPLSPFTGEDDFTHATQDEDHGSRRAGSGIGAFGKPHRGRQRRMTPYNEDSFSASFESMSIGTQFNDSSNEGNIFPPYTMSCGQPSSHPSGSIGEEYGMVNYPHDVTPRPDEGHSICNCSGTYVHQVPL